MKSVLGKKLGMADSRPATVVSQRPCQAEITEAVKIPQRMVSLVKDGTKVSHTSTHSHKKEITTSAGIQLEEKPPNPRFGATPLILNLSGRVAQYPSAPL